MRRSNYLELKCHNPKMNNNRSTTGDNDAPSIRYLVKRSPFFSGVPDTI